MIVKIRQFELRTEPDCRYNAFCGCGTADIHCRALLPHCRRAGPRTAAARKVSCAEALREVPRTALPGRGTARRGGADAARSAARRSVSLHAGEGSQGLPDEPAVPGAAGGVHRAAGEAEARDSAARYEPEPDSVHGHDDTDDPEAEVAFSAAAAE